MHVVVEGESDKATASRVVEFAGRHVLHVTVTRGKTKLDSKLANYSRAARDQPWVVFRDSDNQCPVSLRQRLLAGIPDNPLFALRIVHTMTEAWLMAGRMPTARSSSPRRTRADPAVDDQPSELEPGPGRGIPEDLLSWLRFLDNPTPPRGTFPDPHPTQSQRADPTNGPGHHTRTSLCSCCS